MDLIATLRGKIANLEDGNYIAGLTAVLLHIETAFRHLARGQTQDDDTAFTDAIYRTNQAFEGSTKEAYRVLAAHDPEHKRPYDIEIYLEKNKIFRDRVLKQFKTYRTEWRNPSTHDYKLDFDESEAFLAIVSVSAFACLLLDQIAGRLSFISAQRQVESQRDSLQAQLSTSRSFRLLDRGVDMLKQFYVAMPSGSPSPRQSEAQFIGALHGFINSIAPDITVDVEVKLNADRPLRADLLLRKGEEKLLIEVKRSSAHLRLDASIAQLEVAMSVSGISNAILIVVPTEAMELVAEDRYLSTNEGRIVILTGSDLH